MGGFAQVIIEERLIGEEFTIQAFCDGENLAPMPAAQDHPHAFEGDVGAITGGMGSYSDVGGLLPFLSQDDYDRAVDIMKATLKAIAEEAEPYKGILYGQFMLTDWQTSVRPLLTAISMRSNSKTRPACANTSCLTDILKQNMPEN